MQDNYPIPPHRHTGNEKFSLNNQSEDFSLLDFWQWAYSDLVSNANRGILAEYIAIRALDIPMKVRGEWDAYDLQMEDGTKIEIKTSGYLQSWAQEKLSNIQFSIKNSHAWSAKTNQYSSSQIRSADIYIFCILRHTDPATINPLHLEQWTFLVVTTKVLNEHCPGQKTITLSSLRKLPHQEVGFDGLKQAVQDVRD